MLKPILWKLEEQINLYKGYSSYHKSKNLLSNTFGKLHITDICTSPTKSNTKCKKQNYRKNNKKITTFILKTNIFSMLGSLLLH